jgi:hypothetical protein
MRLSRTASGIHSTSNNDRKILSNDSCYMSRGDMINARVVSDEFLDPNRPIV